MEKPPTPRERLAQARASSRAGDPNAAFLALRPLLAYPAPEETLADARQLFVDVATAIAGPELGATLRRAASWDDPQALFDAGYALYEQQLFDLAATYLARADQLAPGQPAIVGELATALEQLMRSGDAVRVLRGSGVPERDAQVRYLLGFHLLMVGEVDEAAALLPGLRAMAGGDETLAFLADALEGIVERHRRLRGTTPLDARDLTGWHAALHGGLLLHESPHGHAEPMHGRYAFVSDSWGLLREGLDRLAAVLQALELAPERVLAGPDRGSRILARAAAERFGAPLVPFLDQPEAPGLVVVHDLDRVGDEDVLRALHPHRPGQLLFAHASAWVDPFPYAPDVTTLLYQHLVAPWEGGAPVVGPDGTPTRSEPDDAPEEEL
ncbi:MAG TPA: hypothetical protein RMH80_12290, partial [Polyangiaceae bacterium LLY-WYZ-15_(1-7)]|nr:hypothetical protein [Polyangiaceae bacterium LLY-WYZ-15_(1-7)]